MDDVVGHVFLNAGKNKTWQLKWFQNILMNMKNIFKGQFIFNIEIREC